MFVKLTDFVGYFYSPHVLWLATVALNVPCRPKTFLTSLFAIFSRSWERTTKTHPVPQRIYILPSVLIIDFRSSAIALIVFYNLMFFH